MALCASNHIQVGNTKTYVLQIYDTYREYVVISRFDGPAAKYKKSLKRYLIKNQKENTNQLDKLINRWYVNYVFSLKNSDRNFGAMNN